MSNRLSFRAYLKRYTTVKNLYFQPPESEKLKYPCIVYSMSDATIRQADNINWLIVPGYQLILIDKNPDSPHVQELLSMPRCRFDRPYSADNLNHWVFTARYAGTRPEANS